MESRLRRVQERLLFRQRGPAEDERHDVLLLRRKPLQRRRKASDEIFRAHRHDSRHNCLQYYEIFKDAHPTGVRR